jgi:hypothetical protein
MAAISTPGINPSVLVAPDYQTEMLEAQRRLDLANALRQQALTDTPGNGGAVSWTQGLARLAAALSSSANARSGYKEMKGANQAYAAGLRSMFGGAPSPAQQQAAPPAPDPQAGVPQPAPVQPQAPAPADTPSGPVAPGLGASRFPVQSGVDPLAPQPDVNTNQPYYTGSPSAPPQAAPQPPSAPPSNVSFAPMGGATPSGPFNLTGDPNRDMAMYVMNPDEYSKAVVANSAKIAAPTDPELLVNHMRSAYLSGDMATAQADYQALQKLNYIAPAATRPGGWTQDPVTKVWTFHPQAPIPGAVPGPPDADGNMTWRVPAGTEAAVAERAQSQAAGTSAGQAPYQFKEVYDAASGQMKLVPVSTLAGSTTPTGGGNASPGRYTPGAGGSPARTVGSGPGGFAAGPPLGAAAGADTLGKNNADAFQDVQTIATQARQQMQSLREMEGLVNGGLRTGPTPAKQQELAENWGLSWLARDNAFVFNKDSARFIAQSAQNLGLNGSDARLGMLAHATPNMSMTPGALKQVIPVMEGLTMANAAKADANAYWVQHNPQGVMSQPQFESWWRQNYDPRIFTAIARGPAAFKAQIKRLGPQDQQFYMSKYYALRNMGVNFAQFNQ